MDLLAAQIIVDECLNRSGTRWVDISYNESVLDGSFEAVELEAIAFLMRKKEKDLLIKNGETK